MQAIGSGYQNFNSYNNYPSVRNNATFGRQNMEEDNSVQNFAISAGGLGVASLLLQRASKYLGDQLMAGKEFTSPENVKKVADNMVKDAALKDVLVEYIDHSNKGKFGRDMAQALEPVAQGQNAFYLDRPILHEGKKVKLAVAPEAKPSLMLHELGHAVNSSKGKFMQFLQKSRGWAMGIPTALLVLNGLMGKDKDGKKNFVEKNAGLIGFGAFLPTIIEEGMASLRGIKAAAKANLGKSANLNVLKRNYALAWGTYVLAGIGLGVAAKQSVISSN
ncbi:MAG: hypothetical protein WCF95_02475 [bacterium]